MGFSSFVEYERTSVYCHRYFYVVWFSVVNPFISSIHCCSNTLLILTAFPFSGVATANHRFPFYPIFCIFYSDSNYLHVLFHCVYISPLRPTSSPSTW